MATLTLRSEELPDLRRGLPSEAVKTGKEFELSQREGFDHLLLRKEQLSKSNEYYYKVHPLEAATFDKGLAEAAADAEAPSPSQIFVVPHGHFHFRDCLQLIRAPNIFQLSF
jgi:hypothetical protein